MEINYKKLKRTLDEFCVPMWKGKLEDGWDCRPGGGEHYIQDVLAKASPYLEEKALRTATKENLLNALLANNNMVSMFEYAYAKTFIDQTPEEELKRRVLDFLYGNEDLDSRLRRFLDWTKVVTIPGSSEKIGINGTVASYLLSMVNPRLYPFCKPTVYKSAVIELLGREYVKKDHVERILHCQELYPKILKILEDEYGLVDGNLLDVNSLLLFFQYKSKEGLSPWDVINGVIIKPKVPEIVKPIDTTSTPTSPVYDLLMDKKNVILYGPPGTGKTREALLLGNWWRRTYGEDSVSQLTFHPSYCYEDFIEGFRPTQDGQGFQLRDGVFKKICRQANANPQKKYLVIIDEINRGDIARILGELITLLEGDKRGKQYGTYLQQSGELFYVPVEVYVLGTMNTADKSISLMDLAIRRRFIFYPLIPDPDVLAEDKDYFSEIEGLHLPSLLVNLNRRLEDTGVDRNRVLGHSYFLVAKESPEPLEILKNRLRYEVIPLVEEYCYTDMSLMTRIVGDLVEESGAVNIDVFDDNERLIGVLKKLSKKE